MPPPPGILPRLETELFMDDQLLYFFSRTQSFSLRGLNPLPDVTVRERGAGVRVLRVVDLSLLYTWRMEPMGEPIRQLRLSPLCAERAWGLSRTLDSLWSALELPQDLIFTLCVPCFWT